MNKLKTLLSILALASLTTSCSSAKVEGDSYKVEKIGGVPMITKNGTPIRSRIVWVSNSPTRRQDVTMQDPYFQKVAPNKWHKPTFNFTAEDNVENANIFLDFGGKSGEYKIASLSVFEKGAKTPLFTYSAAKDGIPEWTCQNKEKLEIKVTLVDDPTRKEKVLSVTIPENKRAKRMTLSFPKLSLKKGQEYTANLEALASDKRPLTIYAKDAQNRAVYMAPRFDFAFNQIRYAANVGIDFVSFGCVNFWVAKGVETNYDDIDLVYEAILRANPKAMLLPRLMIRPQFQEGWKERYGDHLYQMENGKKKNFVSISSKAYLKQCRKTIREYIKYVEARYAKNMAGYHPGGGNSYEWFYGESWVPTYQGYDPQTLKAWRKWLKKTYKNIDNLKQAWGIEQLSSFEEIPVPTVLERQYVRFFIDPTKNRNVLDFNYFLQDEMGKAVLNAAKAIRDTVGKDRLSMSFYGYSFEFCSLFKGPAYSGHYDLENVLKSGLVDCLCGPISYQDRYFGHAKSTMGPTETINDSGVLWIDEDDTRTYLTDPKDPFYIGNQWQDKKQTRVVNRDETIQVMRRNLAQETIRNIGVWWMDLKNQNWYGDPVLWEEMKLFDKIEKDFIENPKPYTPEVRVVVDEDSMMYIGSGDHIAFTTVRDTMYFVRKKLNRTGTPFGHYLLNDIINREDCAKLNLYPSAFALNSKQREKLKRVAQNSASIWVWLPAYIDLDKNAPSLESVEEVTGFKVKYAEDVNAKLYPTEAGKKIGLTEVYGFEKKVTPLLTPEVKEGDVVLAEFSDKSPAVVLRTSTKHPQLFTAVSEIPIPLYKHMMKISGVHTYVEGPVAVYANKGYVSATATETGEYEFDFKDNCEIFDAYTDKKLGEGRKLKVKMNKGDNRLFKLKTK